MLTDDISYFFNLSLEGKVLEGMDDDAHDHSHFEEKSEFGLGKISTHPLQNFRNLIAFGIDIYF